ncbi:ATP-binding protein [uncultured Anaerococcus sp.]|uniref:ATP-binding protein n=1 Tax=uncultured Anaerococcus sp. TaxID=293428 RepID=UPI00288C3CF2|nr:ATP-binding protein [uncultured Anaerococcus sp.]
MRKINPKEANSIIKSLEAGVVPDIGIGHLLVGRKVEVEEIIKILENIENGDSDLRFWVGDFGSGKSFMLKTIENLALSNNFIVSTIDLNPSRRFYATDRKAVGLYQAIIENIKTKTKREGNVIEAIIEEWISNIFMKLAQDYSYDMKDLMAGQYQDKVKGEILDILANFKSVGLSYELGQALCKYYEGFVADNRLLKLEAIRWIRGDISTKTEAKKELGINEIINDDNYFEAIKNLAELFAEIGYKGFVINFDEAVNLYKLPHATTRERNYERILNIFNETKSNLAKHLFINFGATRKTVFDESRGLASYGALKGRLGNEASMDDRLVNTNKTVLGLRVLTEEEIYTLLENLVDIYNTHYKSEINLSHDQIVTYMEGQLNRPGADEFLTPRSVIKDFIEILDIKRQNQDVDINQILANKFGSQVAVFKDPDNLDDEIEII